MRKVKVMFFMDIIFSRSLFGQVCGSPFLASYCGNNLGIDMLAQHATSVVSCMVKLEHNRRNGRHFPPFPLPAPLSHGKGRGFESRRGRLDMGIIFHCCLLCMKRLLSEKI